MTSIGQVIYFFEPYDNICIFNLKTDKKPRKTNIEAISDDVISQKTRIIFHKIGKGFACIDSSEKYHEFTCNRPFNQYTIQFQVSGNQLLAQNGNSIELYLIDFKKYTLKYIGTINLTFPFLDIKIVKITGSDIGFHLFTGDYVFTVKFFSKGKQIDILQQQYLGQWNTNLWLYSNSSQFVIDRGDAIQVVNQSKKSNSAFRPYQGADNNALFPLEGILNIYQNKNFKIISVGSNYFDIHRSLFEVSILDVNDTKAENVFFTGNRYRWINALPVGRYNLTVNSQSTTSSNFVWSNLIFYKDLPFWIIVLLIFVLLFLYYNTLTKAKGTLNRRIVLLKLKTLQNNFNPHFIYNCMSLIQSLIIGDQQKKAIEVTAKLAKLNRTFLENSNNEMISLDDEINFLKEYVGMEKLRFESDTEFKFQIHIPKNFNTKSWQIPPMILQPLIENSIKHGVMASKNSTTIDLFLHATGNQILEIRIENNYPKKQIKSSKGIGIGLKLVADRLSLLSELHPNLFRTSFKSGVEENDKYVAQIVIEHILTPEETFQIINQFKIGKKKQDREGVKYNIPLS
jgi:hypothetical protein